jgi:hypothetical protein
MISKADLMQRLNEVMWEEEHAYPIYQRHIIQSIPWYGFSEEEEARLRETLTRIGQETDQHKQMLEEILQQVQEGERDVY